MSKEHLKPPRSKQEAQERGRKGGVSSGEARAKKKTIREIVEAYLVMVSSKTNRTAKPSCLFLP